MIFDEQVINGGLNLYFYNGYGFLVYLTIENLNLIKAYTAANILSRALDEINNDKLSEEDFRRKAYDRDLSRIMSFEDNLFEILDKLDDEYYKEYFNNEVKGDIFDYLIKYLQNFD